MATTTTNIGLTKPSGSDKVQIAQLNLNSDIIDEKIGPVGNTSLQDQITAINNNLSSIGTKMLNIPLFNGDCNGITETCTVYVGSSAAGSPGPWHIMHTVVFNSDDAIVQYAISVPNGTMKMRSKTGNPASWTDWTLVSVNHNYLFGTTMNLSQFINRCETIMNLHPGFSQIGFINYQQAVDIALPSSGYLFGMYDASNDFKKILYHCSVNNTTCSLQKVNGTWEQRWHKSRSVDYIDVTVPVGTTAGAYKVGTFASLGIPSWAVLLCAQCINATSSVCHVTGTSVYGNDIYVYVVETVAVNAGQVRIVYAD